MQKARTNHLKLKDHNTKFHHAMATMRNKNNNIYEVVRDGRIFKGARSINQNIISHDKQ